MSVSKPSSDNLLQANLGNLLDLVDLRKQSESATSSREPTPMRGNSPRGRNAPAP